MAIFKDNDTASSSAGGVSGGVSSASRPSGRIERGDIVAKALEIMNDGGLEALTMRRLAKALNVQAPALYWHFDSKKALMDAMLDGLLGENLDVRRAGEEPDLWLARIGRQLRATLLEYRDAARLAVQVNSTPRLIGDTMPRFIAAFRDIGFRGQDAVYVPMALVAFVIGWVQTEQNIFVQAASDGGEGDSNWLGISGHTVTSRAFGVMDMDEGFETALGLLIAGYATAWVYR